MTLPPSTVKEAIDRGIASQVTSRVEVYEADAVTLWNGGLADRLISGSVNISYGDNERRTLDLTLQNIDNLLRSSSEGFWYDKVIKLYRGVNYSPDLVPPKVAIVESVGGISQSGLLISWLASIGLPGAKYINYDASVVELMEYDIIISYTGTTATTKGPKLKDLYALGKNIITISVANTGTHVPFLTSVSPVSIQWGISQVADPTSLNVGWTDEAVGPAATAGMAAGGVSPYAVAVARYSSGGGLYAITGSVAVSESGGRWFNLHLPSLGGANVARLSANVADWFKQDYGDWETQIGEFNIDGISNPDFPAHVKITGRDYVKKCANSKIESPMTFDSGTTVDTLVRALAANAGIKKFRLASMPETIASTLSFDRGTQRWEVMGAAARTQGYEIYFDGEGYLTTRKYRDPTSSPETYVFQTGKEGNLASIDRSVNDSRIYNHIVVYGDPASGEERLPYVGEAKNTNPSSPTRIERLGDRYYSYASTFFTDTYQTEEYANRLLSLHSLESFELSFQAINYPWMEVGEIARVVDPKAISTDPTKYLIDTANIPLDLGPMSFTGKRVIMV